MSNLAWKLLTFSLLINISAAIITNVIGWDNNIYDSTTNDVLSDVDIYNINDPNSIKFESPPVETESNWADNLLGLLGLGFITDFLALIVKYLFGAIDVVLSILPAEAQEFRPYLIGVFTLVYSYSLFTLFTGKKLNEDG